MDKCVGALLAYLKRESKTRGDGDSEKSKKLPLFTDAEAISVTVGLKQMPTDRRSDCRHCSPVMVSKLGWSTTRETSVIVS